MMRGDFFCLMICKLCLFTYQVAFAIMAHRRKTNAVVSAILLEIRETVDQYCSIVKEKRDEFAFARNVTVRCEMRLFSMYFVIHDVMPHSYRASHVGPPTTPMIPEHSEVFLLSCKRFIVVARVVATTREP